MHKKAKEKSFNLDFFEKRRPYRTLFFVGGWGEIRTPGGSPLNGFQDRRIKPLCHPSNNQLEVSNTVLRKPFLFGPAKKTV